MSAQRRCQALRRAVRWSELQAPRTRMAALMFPDPAQEIPAPRGWKDLSAVQFPKHDRCHCKMKTPAGCSNPVAIRFRRRSDREHSRLVQSPPHRSPPAFLSSREPRSPYFSSNCGVLKPAVTWVQIPSGRFFHRSSTGQRSVVTLLSCLPGIPKILRAVACT